MVAIVVEVVPENVFNELMEQEAIHLSSLVEQLCMDSEYTKKNLKDSDILQLKHLIEEMESKHD